jgi:hypothetical protein
LQIQACASSLQVAFPLHTVGVPQYGSPFQQPSHSQLAEVLDPTQMPWSPQRGMEQSEPVMQGSSQTHWPVAQSHCPRPKHGVIGESLGQPKLSMSATTPSSDGK